MKTHRKKYLNIYGSIPNGWEIHHIDWNHKNNDISNLIAVPRSLHVFIHQVGFMNRIQITNLIKIWNNLLHRRKFLLWSSYIKKNKNFLKHDNRIPKIVKQFLI